MKHGHGWGLPTSLIVAVDSRRRQSWSSSPYLYEPSSVGLRQLLRLSGDEICGMGCPRGVENSTWTARLSGDSAIR